jgi:MinD-like ATPase involved in chromosome partitioning or flagellar assembly
VVKKITTDPDDLEADGEDHGVLAAAGLDTTAIGILSPQTAQVRVVLPQVLEEPDDEIVDDEIEPGDLRSGGIVIELPADEVDEIEAAAEAAETAGDETTLTGEIIEEPGDAEDEVIDVVVVSDAADAADEPEDGVDRTEDAESGASESEQPESEESESEESDAEEFEAEELEAEASGFDEPESEEPENGAQDELEESEPEDAEGIEAAADADEIPEEPDAVAAQVDAWRAAAAALAAEHAAAHAVPDPAEAEGSDDDESPEEGEDAFAHLFDDEDEPDDAEDADEAEDSDHAEDAHGAEDADDVTPEAPLAEEPAPAATPAQRPQTFARLWAEETAAARAASTSLEPAPLTKTQTTGALEMTARRLEDLGRNADRESSDLLTPDRVLNPQRAPKAAPEGVWSELVYGLTGGRVNLGDSRKARARKALEARVAAPLAGETRFVPVLSRKGGVGKTTVTTLLGMALADGREDRVIAIDANPDRGTLADRIGKRVDKTVRDLVHTAGDIRGFSDMSRFVARDETRLDVLASDTDPRISQAFGEEDYRTVADVAEHFYSLVLTDTGTGIIHSVMGATLKHADQLVIVTGLSLDEVRLASETLTWLESNGYEDLARNSIVVLNQQSAGAPMVRLSELEVHFGSRVRTVVHLPYDPALATGSAIVYRELQPETRQAARELAARVIDGLRAEGRTA